MLRLDLIAYRSWYGPLRRPFRAIARRLMRESQRILCGPLKGQRFAGEELACRMGIYELHVQYALKELLNPGDVFYDVGANNGYLTLLGARSVGPHGIVYAFEPLLQNAHRLHTVLKENQISNYQLFQKAVSNQTGQTGMMELYLGDDSDSYTPSLIRGCRGRVIQVDVTTLDEFAAEYRWPDLIKMDVEGAEVMVLEGAKKILSDAAAPRWLIEAHSSETDQQVKKVLLDHGYSLRTLTPPLLRKPYPTHIVALK